MIQVINNEITQTRLPKTGTLSDGRTVSGYHLLDADTLRKEGWLPLEDRPPLYNTATHYLVHDGYDIQPDKVIRLYRVEPIPEPEPDPWEGLLDKVNTLMLIASKQVDDIPLSEDEKEEVGRWFELAPEEPPGKEPPDEEPPFGEIGRG